MDATSATIPWSRCAHRSYHFVLVGGPSVCGGGQNFLGWSEGGPKFFIGSKRGGQNFFLGPRGGGQNFFWHLRCDFLWFPHQKIFRAFSASSHTHRPSSFIYISTYMYILYIHYRFMTISKQGMVGVFNSKGGGARIFFARAKGGPKFFARWQGGGQNFFACPKGGPEKIDGRRSRIDGPPLPVKNYTSLTGSEISLS